MNINQNLISQLNGVGLMLTTPSKSGLINKNNKNNINNTQTYTNDDLDEDQEGDELLKNEIDNNNYNKKKNTKSISTINKSSSNNIDLDINNNNNNNNNIKSNRSSSMKQRVRTTSGNTNTKNVDILTPSLSTNKITSPIKQNKNNVSRSSSKINNNHEITFMFKKNRSISHSHTTKYDLYEDENNDEKQIVEDEQNDKGKTNTRNVSKSNHHISSPKLRQKSIMNDIVDSITCEGAVAGAIIAGVPMHGANITNIPTTIAGNSSSSSSSTNTNNKTGSSTLSSSSSQTNESSSLSSKSDNACSSASTSDLSTNPKSANDNKQTNFIEETHHNLNSNNLNKSKIYTKHQYIKQTEHDDLKVIILDDKTKNDKRDSIRMRHYSNTGQQNNSINKIALDGIEENSSKSRLFRRWKRTSPNERQKHKSHNYIVIFLLFVVNLLNYIDRYTLAG
jgi:hypothetical protein